MPRYQEGASWQADHLLVVQNITGCPKSPAGGNNKRVTRGAGRSVKVTEIMRRKALVLVNPAHPPTDVASAQTEEREDPRHGAARQRQT